MLGGRAVGLLLVAALACAAEAGSPKFNAPSLVGPTGWLEIHTCAHREEPYVRGSDIVHGQVEAVDPFTAADDPYTTLTAVFTRGYDDQLWGRWQVTTREGWGDWEEFGSPNDNAGLRSVPYAVADGSSMIVVLAIANDGQVYAIRQFDHHIFGNWTLVGSMLGASEAALSSNLTAVRAENGRLFVYIDVDGYIYETHETAAASGVWEPWRARALGDSRVLSRIAVALNPFTGLLEAFALLDDRCLYQAWQHNDESWRGWKALWECWSQPRFTSNPVVHVMSGSVMNGELEVFIRGEDNSIWHTWQTTCVPIDNPWSFCTWGAYYEIGRNCPAPSADGQLIDLFVSSNIHEGLEVFVTGTDGQLYHLWQVEMWGDWSGWEPLGHPSSGPLTSQPCIVHDRTGWWTAYARGQTGDLEIYVQERSLQALPRRVAYGEPVQLIWRVPENEACADDWIAVYQPQAENSDFLDFVFVNGELNPGSKPVPNGIYNYSLYLPDGIYEIRYLANYKPVDVMRVLIKVSGTSDLSPPEQIFSGITIGLGEKAWNFENCSDNLMETFDLFREAFDQIRDGDVYRGLNLLGEALDDYADSMEICSTTAIAEAIHKFAKDLISCVFGACARFVISVVAEFFIIYMNIHEITMDIMAADNNMAIEAYEQAGVHIGDLLRAVIQVRP